MIDKDVATYSMHIELAEKMISNQLYKEALSILDKLLLNYNDPDIFYLKAKIFFLQGKFSEAIDVLMTLINIDSSYLHGYELLGECYRCLNNLELAETFYQKAISVDPKTLISWLGKGKIAYKKGDYHEAVLCFKTYLNDNVEQSEIWLLLARSYLNMNHTMEAIDAYNMAIEFDPLNVSLYEELGDLYIKLGREDIAKEKYLQALQVEEKTRDIPSSIYIKTVRILLKEGKFLKAFNLCNELLSFDPDNIDALFLSGKALVGLGNKKEGKDRVEQAYSLKKTDEYYDYLIELEKLT